MKKRIILFAAFFTLLLTAPTYAATFSDIQKGSELQFAITELQAKGVISGYPDGTFKPNHLVKREQLAKMIAVSLALKAPTTTVVFSDVTKTHANYAYIQALVANKIVNGYPDGTFKPSAFVTRAQSAKMIATAYKVPPYSATLPFKDIKASSERYADIQALYFNGIASGTSTATFSPGNNITRGQAVLFIYRALKLKQGAVIKEMTISNSSSIELIAQEGNIFKTTIIANKIRVLPITNGTGTLFIKDNRNNYMMYEVKVADKKASLTEIDWHNHVDIKLNYYVFSQLQLPFPVSRVDIRDENNGTISSDLYYLAYDDLGMELAFLIPGTYAITFKGENNASRSYKAHVQFSKFTLATTIYP